MLDDLLLSIHRDIADYLRLDAELAELPVIDARTETPDGGSVQDLIEDALSAGALIQRGGKAGLAIVVLLPEVRPSAPEAPGPLVQLVCTVRVFENRLINESDAGFGLSAGKVVLHIARVLNQWPPLGTNALAADAEFIKDISIPDTEGYEITFVMTSSLPPITRTARPTISAVAGGSGMTVTLACSTAGASIYYTTDGRLPTLTDGTLYSAPLEITEATTLRAIALSTGRAASAPLSATISES